MTPSSRSLRGAWAIHAAVLLTLATLYIVASWDTWFAPPDRSWHVERLGEALLMALLLGYACVTTAVMPWVGRRLYGPVVMHGLLLATCFAISEENPKPAVTPSRSPAAAP